MSAEISYWVGMFIFGVIVAGAAGCFAGLVVASRVAGRLVARYMPDFPEVISTPTLNVTVLASEEDGRVCVQTSANLKAQELSAFYVDRWLDKRGLVASPKGADFKAATLNQKQEI